MTPITAFRRTALALALPLCLGMAPTVLASAPAAAPAAEEESTEAKVVRYTRELEQSPTSEDAPEMRRALMNWAFDGGHLVINVCNVMDLPEHGAKDRSPITVELTQQTVFGNAAFQIEHGTETDELARQVAATQSALKVYSNFVAKDPSLRIAQMETLLAQQKAGRLERQLAPVVAECDAMRRTRLAQPGDDVPFLGGFLRDTSVIYPLRLGSWEFASEQRPEEDPTAAGLLYERPGDDSGWINVYFYPVGILDAGQVAEYAAGTQQDLAQNWGEQLPDQPMSKLSTFSIPVKASGKTPYGYQPRAASVTAHQADFSFRREGTMYTSAFVFMVDRLYGIEIRYISEAAKLDGTQMRKAIEAFARELHPQLEIISSGSCGLPIMGVDGKIADGCDGIEAVTPAVPEGKRELRLEYAPPSS